MIPCPFHDVKIQFYRKDKVTPTNRPKRFTELPEEIEARVKRGQKVLIDVQCPGNLLVEIGYNNWDSIGVTWICTHHMIGEEYLPKLPPLPFDTDTMNSWVNKQLGYEV